MLSIEEIKLLIEKLKKLNEEDFKSLIGHHLDILQDLEKTIDINNKNQIKIVNKTEKWFKLDLQERKKHPTISQILQKSVESKIYQFGKTNLFNSLEIGPGNGTFSKSFRAWRLNYFLDVQHVETEIRKLFPPQHQKYLKFYITENSSCQNIPANSCNFIFSWETFVFFTQHHIKQYLQDMKRVLIPGGYCMIHYSDCHFDYDLNESSRGYWQYNTKSSMEKIIEESGYKIIEMNQFCPGANYAIFQKPGKQNPVVYRVSEITVD